MVFHNTDKQSENTFTGHFYSFEWYIFRTFDIYPSRIYTYNYSLQNDNILNQNEFTVDHIQILLEYNRHFVEAYGQIVDTSTYAWSKYKRTLSAGSIPQSDTSKQKWKELNGCYRFLVKIGSERQM